MGSRCDWRGVSWSRGGGLSAALAGGDLGDVIRGATIGGISGAITAGALHGIDPGSGGLFTNPGRAAIHIAGHGVVGGATNEAMGGKFQDGFYSAAVSAAAADAGLYGLIGGDGPISVAARTTAAGIVSGTASVVGGGKFANGAYTGAFQYYLNMEFMINMDPNSPNYGKPDPAAGVNFGPPTDPVTPFFVEGVIGGGIAKGVFSLGGAMFRSVFGRLAANNVTRWGPATGAGPLGAEVASTFRGGSYTELVTQEATTLYRVYGGKAGELGYYWTRTPPAGPLQARIDSAMLPKWGNTANSVSKITVPKGTTIFEGFAAPQGNLVGGGSQVFIPKPNPSWLVK